jgi:acyl-lipid omega-6 desaturase (Delta-12 desaturase)
MSAPDLDAPERNSERSGKELIAATRPFAVDDRALSWFHTATTAATLVLLALLAGSPTKLPWLLRVLASVLTGLMIVRMFVLFHDFMHLAILRGSRLAKALFHTFGMLILVPPSVWKETHNYHHAHTAKIVGSHVGSFAMVTTTMWRTMSPRQRFLYRAVRHPLTILLAYGTVFLWGMAIGPFLRAPRRHPGALVSVLTHAGLIAFVALRFGIVSASFGVLLPMAIACALGAYLFYAQHNFPGVYVADRTHWSYSEAALRSSSYLELGPVLRFFTANIGFHHVHHLNAGIPFYRLPEAMQTIPELTHPTTITLSPRTIIACLRLALWDPERAELVPFPSEDAS